MSDCCAASRGSVLQPFGTGDSGSGVRPQVSPVRFEAPVRARASAAQDMARIPAGSFVMGADDDLSYPGDGEGPLRTVELGAFEIDACAVTNEEFAAFVEATGYTTESERLGWSFVFAGLLADDFPPTRAAADAPWWRQVEGASWQCPEGTQSDIDARLDHPVVHVSWNDALTYAEWAGKSLPSEAQWERAARGGLESQPYPWGDELTPGGEHRMNVWQGVFPPTTQTRTAGTRPARSIAMNPTASVCTTRRAMSGNGAPTGSMSSTTRRRLVIPQVRRTAISRCSRAAASSVTRATACAIAPPPARG